MTRLCPIVVLASGNGTNLQAIIDRARDGRLPVSVRAVLSDRENAYALQRARRADIPALFVDPSPHTQREAYDAELAARIVETGAELVVLAGFMRILSAAFVQRFEGRLLNVHPSLLPKHRGLHTHRRVLEAGEREHGTSVHFVTPDLDAGPVILQARIPVLPGDSEESLQQRVQAQEYRIYPQAIEWFAQGRLEMRDGAAWLDGEQLPPSGCQIT